ncbi:LamG-like jellyroll fold domain-containing protein [Lacinutrix sp. MedPE-SW]|uniref:LamG-like jellyroll fold domain-containing protein n=1 Tax=Lacinutrix sp. MedPE-SW TaxID=1860087 RepID=UPI00091A2300|nr:LamG-like jellyroll fold domain-containing protein [Lacinutrix sp. MedPE-SW]OIQ21956.1 MAG: hypothetical protein BM549_08470 [Lacinutrix sp. MedPE-SW]
MRKTTLTTRAIFCAFIIFCFNISFAQTADFDNDGIVDYRDVDDDNDGLRDTVECPAIAGAGNAQADKISWSKNGFDVYTIGANTNGNGYIESGFQKAVYDKGQPLTVLNGAADYSFPPSSFAGGGTATSSVGTFGNGTMDFEHNYLYRSYEIHQFRTTTSGGFTSGGGVNNGVYVYPEVGNQTGDYYTVNINFTEPVASFSFDFVDIYDTNVNSAIVNYEVYADGNLVAYFSNNYIGNDVTSNINLYDADGILKGTLLAGQNIENTIGFVTDDFVSTVSIRHIVTSGALAASTHDPHGLDTFSYSFPCAPQLDIDVDNDGIPDNIEAQSTAAYITPSGIVNTSGSNIGMWTNYGAGVIPVNTDGTDLVDYLDTDTDNDGVLDIDENGQANTLSSLDTDRDGLDDNLDFVTANFDSNDEVTSGTLIDRVNTFGDFDNDAGTTGDLDFRDNNTLLLGSQTIDFDGVDDYLDTPNFISNWTEATIMGWVKIENTSTGNLPNLYSIAGQENFRLYISNGRIPNLVILTQAQVDNSGNNYPSNNITVEPDVSLNLEIENNMWYHIAGVFDASTSSAKLYVNGELVGTVIDSNLNSELLTKNFNGTNHIYSTREFTIGRYPTNTSIAGFGHFNGNIDEVRVLKKALTTDQLQRTVYQEIENNLGYVKGSVIDKDILDINTAEKISWESLEAYYPMTTILNNRTLDESNKSRHIVLNNIKTVQEQTAPMPYESLNNGLWTAESTWLHGDVWDIENLPNKNWSIVHIKDVVTTSASHSHIGLIVDAGKTLRVLGNNEIYNDWYLELNGTIDLREDSQLVQSENSELATSSAGRIIRRQEGQTSIHRYNFWGSPVGIQNTTANNTGFRLNMLRDASGNIQFTSAYNPPVTTPATISTAWTYTFQNDLSYYDWAPISQTSLIAPGVGYTQKGTGHSGLNYQYRFIGKPNNGNIDVVAIDNGGTGSVAGSTKTEYLLSNPYPSAIDVHEFIDDNSSVIGGEIYFWEQWAGDSHVTTEYEGGYAIVNKLAGVRAYQHSGEFGNTGDQNGTKKPSRYIPVAQGFFTEIVSNGTVKFRNDQRIFKKEADADNTYNNGSVFFKGKNTTTESKNYTESVMRKIRLKFEASNNLSRELVLGFSEQTSDAFDYGYDADIDVFNTNDLATVMNGDKYVIQAFSAITLDKEVDLVLNSDANLSYAISMIEIENIEDSQDVFLLDTQENIYHNLKTGGNYNFTAAAGEDNSRFKIVFNNGTDTNETLSTSDFEASQDDILIFANNSEGSLYVKGLKENAKSITLINMLGQTVLTLKNKNAVQLSSGVPIINISAGVYLVDVKLQNGKNITRKITLN